MKVAFHTLGCKVNQYETEYIKQNFIKANYEIVDFEDFADIYIVNTCTVTNMADKKSRQMINRPKKINQDAVVVAIGCYAQREDGKLDDNLDIDLIIGNTKKNHVLEVVEDFLKNHVRNYLVESMDQTQDYETMWLADVSENVRAYIKVQDGCNQFCAYCIIPYVRGRIRRRPYLDIISEVEQLVEHGFKEVVLTGIHLASYQDESNMLIDLIEGIHAICGLERVRLGSLEPNLITDEFASRLGKMSKICAHFHLSLQSGCDITLEAMNRKYTTAMYMERVNLLRQYFKTPAFTTDIIVGFPDESDDDFAKTVSFVKSIGFLDVHVFKYSIREGTKAASMTNQIDGMITDQRSKALIRIGKIGHEAYLTGMVGKIYKVLIEEHIEYEDQDYYIGHTENYVKFYIKTYEFTSKINKIILAKALYLIEDIMVGAVV
jgi:threonylcarbamoyladenosine tRNA methylthiotransferase MtaB